MAPATRKVCDYPGCTSGEADGDGCPQPYATPSNLQTRDEVAQDLKEHTFRAHELPLRAIEAGVKKIEAETMKIQAETARVIADRPAPQVVQASVSQSVGHQEVPRLQDRRDKIPRPTVDEGISQSDWNFFVSQWTRYVKGTGLTGDSVVLHMWEACSDTLQRSLHHAGAGAEEDAEKLMALIKSLSVKKHNNLVNIIELQRIGQHRDETVMAYSARINGQASLCDLYVECPGCSSHVSFKEKLVMYQLVRGLEDKEMLERVLQAAAQVEGGELSLNRVTKLCEALEMGKASSTLVNSASGSLNRMSAYQRQKTDGKQQHKWNVVSFRSTGLPSCARPWRWGRRARR